MALLVIRHAKAGKRSAWRGDDRVRPLTKKGRVQAEDLVAKLARFPIDSIASSGYVRCSETVRPLAEARAIPIELRPELEEGASREETLALLKALGDRAAVCSHGDVLTNLFGADGQKGSTRVAELHGDEFRVLEYLAAAAD